MFYFLVFKCKESHFLYDETSRKPFCESVHHIFYKNLFVKLYLNEFQLNAYLLLNAFLSSHISTNFRLVLIYLKSYVGSRMFIKPTSNEV